MSTTPRKQKRQHLLWSVYFLPTFAHAESLAPMKGATTWLYSTLVSVAVTVLGLQIMYRLWQVNQGQKEWAEVIKPILITAAIIAVPTLITALVSAMS